jgi:hypothetical protein
MFTLTAVRKVAKVAVTSRARASLHLDAPRLDVRQPFAGGVLFNAVAMGRERRKAGGVGWREGVGTGVLPYARLCGGERMTRFQQAFSLRGGA